MKESVEYIVSALLDELGLDAGEAIEVLFGVVQEIANQTEDPSRTLEDFANGLV